MSHRGGLARWVTMAAAPKAEIVRELGAVLVYRFRTAETEDDWREVGHIMSAIRDVMAYGATDIDRIRVRRYKRRAAVRAAYRV